MGQAPMMLQGCSSDVKISNHLSLADARAVPKQELVASFPARMSFDTARHFYFGYGRVRTGKFRQEASNRQLHHADPATKPCWTCRHALGERVTPQINIECE